MGKKRITQLLDELNANHQADLQNAAAIFTVAQVAANQLEAIALGNDPTNEKVLKPADFDKKTLKERYGSFNACRKAAKQKGICFRKTPTWEQLGVAFSYFDAINHLIQSYIEKNPNPNLHGLSIEFKIG